ncbi:MAG: hypothetical protein II809_02380 [Bacteroidales bacterium]|nr:hypothetical protein [Bacteroidales bacterium]
MKKLFYFAAFAACVLTSCQQVLDIQEKEEDVKTPGLVFTATTESSATKTALEEDSGNYNVAWRSGDEITIVDAAATPNVGVYSTGSNTTSADFTFDSGKKASTAPFKAWYPASIYNNGTPTLPATQEYVEGNIAGSPMFASSSTTSLKFKNLAGIICLNLSTGMADISVASIALSATQPMSGPISNAESLSSETPVAATVSGSAGVTLNCGAGVAINGTPKPFYFAVPAGTYSGLSITVTATSGATQTFTLKTERTIVVERSQITNINLTANNIHSEYDLTADNVTVPAGALATVTGSSDEHTLTIEAGATVTLEDATCKQIITHGDATLILNGANVVAPITTDRFNAIIPADNSTLTIGGTGSLDCSRWSSGTMNYCINNSTVNLVIDGGVLTFNSSRYKSPSAVVVNDYTQNSGTVSISVSSNNNDGDRYPEGLYAYGNISISGGSLTANGSVAVFAKGDMTISGGTVSATGDYRHYYGSSGLTALGTLTISGGSVTASGSGGAVTGPGIGSVSTCGDIVISGGTVTATGSNSYGANGSAGIGTGSGGGTCGHITITSGITRLVVTKASSAQAPIGNGKPDGTVGTITIDGVVNPTAESFFENLNLEVSNGGNTWTLTPASNTPASLAHLKDLVNAGKDASAYLGRYVYADGSIGTDETDAIGLVAYMNKTATQLTGINEACRILVLGISDISSGTDVGAAWDLCNAKGYAIAGADWSNWRIPTTGQWNVICQSDGLGQGSFANLSGDDSKAKLNRALTYWTSSIHHNDANDYGWPWTINYSDPGNDANLAYVNWSWARSDYQRAARAVFGF